MKNKNKIIIGVLLGVTFGVAYHFLVTVKNNK